MTRIDTLSELRRRQDELQQREREIVEAGYLRRADGIEGIRDAIRRLGELGSPSGILARAAQELGSGSQFDRILLSEVVGGQMRPLRLWEREPRRTLPDAVIALEYPLVEYDAVRGRQSQLVDVRTAGARTPAALDDALRWTQYAVAPIVVESEVIGLAHADAYLGDRVLNEIDRELLVIACTGLGEVFDRAVLRETLQRHRAELQSAITWMNGRLRATGAEGGPAALTSRSAPVANAAVIESLTVREREILRLLALGNTNAAIAQTLLVREGTVKYHVKNVLRKLGARSRADAVARYVRATGEAPR